MPFPLFLPPAGPHWTVEQVQREIDSITAQINQAVSDRSAGNGFRIVDISTALERLRVGNAALGAGQSVDLEVEVTQDLERAGLFLSFGGTSLDFLVGSSFTLEITGNNGSRDLSFTSGNTLAQVAASISTFDEETGVTALHSGSGVILFSSSYGSNEFVSVRTGGDATIVGRGVYGLRDTEPPVADAAANICFFNTTIHPVIDRGQNLVATVNQTPVRINGSVLIYFSPELTAQLDLARGPLGFDETANASNEGTFTAARVIGTEPRGPLSDKP